MEERYIASVDLGTAKIAVCVARIQGLNVQVVYYRESPSKGIRNSYVLNPKKVEDVLRTAITNAQQELKMKISEVIVGLPRYYVRQEVKSASMERENEETPIMEQELRDLKNDALKTYPLKDSNTEVVYGAVAQSFSTEDCVNELESDIVGMTAATLEGNFKVFVGNRRHSSNIDSIFRSMGISIAKKYFTPGITAKAVLKEEQMDNGVALIDLGAGVSSVTIFEGRIMRFYSAIPFGGNSVTNDIKTECGISFELAENIKKGYGACIHEKLSSFGNKTLQINDDNDNTGIQVGVKYISQIIDARMEEIIEALLYSIQNSGYADRLRSGIVVTGGCVGLVNIVNFIKSLSGCMVSIGTPKPFFTCDDNTLARGSSAATTMGMIYAAKADKSLNCTSRPPLQMKRTETLKAMAPKTEYIPENRPETVEREHFGGETPADRDNPAFSLPHISEDEGEVREDTQSIESSVAAAQEDAGTLLHSNLFGYDDEEPAAPQKKEKKRHRIKWLKHVTDTVGSLFDDMDNEEV
ncbi:MAG: cell division protein FtsA [Candidatus Cryptobacteroides sp.]